MKTEEHGKFGSNAVRLNGRDWLAVAAIVVAVCFLTPRLWRGIEPFEDGPDFRFPYGAGNDYWLYERWCGRAAETYSHFLVGDSVIWGQYAARDETLSHYLNEAAGNARFANLGLDGLHPAAMTGLIRYYCGPIRNRPVLVNFNPLWMTSPRRDLQGKKEIRFNHPKLVPQMFPGLPCYKPSFRTVVAVTGERYLSFFSWLGHLKTAYFDNMSLKEWTLKNPYVMPWSPITLETVKPRDGVRLSTQNWEERGITEQDFPWVDPAESLQWRSFQDAVGTLRSRGNRVFVLVGPFNPYVMTGQSRTRYLKVRKQCETWLTEEGIPYYTALDLPSALYADTSHPLAEGYRQLADGLLESKPFVAWMADGSPQAVNQ